jgi:hypothetical protein
LPKNPATTPNLDVQIPVNFDNATKLLTFAKPNTWIGAVTFGDAVIGTTASDLRTPQSFVPEFEVGLPPERLSVANFSQRRFDQSRAIRSRFQPSRRQLAIDHVSL